MANQSPTTEAALVRGEVNDKEKGEERPVDWDFAHEELMAKQGIDLKQEMAKKLKEMEHQWRKEKEEANEAFQQERKVYLNIR